MKKNQVYIIVIILVAGIAAWFGYKYFNTKKNNVAVATQHIPVAAFSPNSCWVYHEYVYKVDFRDPSMEPYLFVRNADGTFSLSNPDSAGNHVIGNGFLIDADGACATTEKIATPWVLNDKDQQPLRAMLDAWLELKPDLLNKGYTITGQTVALFVVLNDPKDFIEYTGSAPVPGQTGYSLIYPYQKTQLKGVAAGIGFANETTGTTASIYQVLKTSFDENNPENPVVRTSIDSFTATRNTEGYLENIQVIKGDEFFYEGSLLFNAAGKCLGNLHFERNKWKLVPFYSFVQDPPAYKEQGTQEEWEYMPDAQVWKRTFPSFKTAETAVDESPSGNAIPPGPLEPVIQVYPSPVVNKEESPL